MAVLSVGDLSLEIAYRDFEGGWVNYDIWLRWQGEPVINDAILKRQGEYWGKRGIGAISASADGECGVLPLLRRVIETQKSDYWEPIDPDILLAVYVDGSFPFLPSKWVLIEESPQQKAEREERTLAREKSGPLLDDLVEIILFADIYNFSGAEAYAGDGFCFRLTPTYAALQNFYGDLRGEYVAFRERHDVQGFNRDVEGAGYEPWF